MPQQISPAMLGRKDRFLLYGDSGTGKTHCALTAPPPIYYVCTGAENELDTFYSKNFQDNYKKLHGHFLQEKDLQYDFVDLPFSWKNDDASGFDQIKAKVEKAVVESIGGGFQFNSVVFDNASTLIDLQIEKAIKLSAISSSTDKSTEKKYNETGILQVADFEWKDVMNMMEKFLSEVFVLDKVFVVIAHEWEQVVTDRATKVQSTTKIKPAFIGKQRDDIPNMFSNVWRMYNYADNKTAARTIGKDSNPVTIAKTRIGGIIPTEWPDPDIQIAIQKFKVHAQNQSNTNLPK